MRLRNIPATHFWMANRIEWPLSYYSGRNRHRVYTKSIWNSNSKNTYSILSNWFVALQTNYSIKMLNWCLTFVSFLWGNKLQGDESNCCAVMREMPALIPIEPLDNNLPMKSSRRVNKPHLCQRCDKTFAMPHLLKNHQRTHTNERPYSCDVRQVLLFKIVC